MIELKSIDFFDWGLRTHEEVLQLQQSCWQSARSGQEKVLMGELQPVITLGLRTKDEDLSQKTSLPLSYIDRGGSATVHSPGQLVIYPILNLKARRMSPKVFIETLMKVTSETVTSFGISSRKGPEDSVGVWTQKGKIAFCGVRIREGVVQHGISLNVSNDLSLFNQIHPCGFQDLQLDSIQGHSPQIQMYEVKKRWLHHFKSHNAFAKDGQAFVSVEFG